MDKTLLNTDTISEITRRINATVVARAAAYRAAFGYYTLSVLSVIEVVKGYHRMKRTDSSSTSAPRTGRPSRLRPAESVRSAETDYSCSMILPRRKNLRSGYQSTARPLRTVKLP